VAAALVDRAELKRKGGGGKGCTLGKLQRQQKNWANKKPRPKPGFEENDAGGNVVDPNEEEVCERSA
jgi:hypothetical protein